MSEARDYCVPFVAAIIERKNADGDTELLIQIRNQTFVESIYNGTYEFAAGTMDVPYENVFDAVAREVREETGLTVSRFIDESRTEPASPQKSDLVFGFRPFCCTQQLRDGKPWVGFIFRCEVEDGEPRGQAEETKDVRWMKMSDFRKIFTETPEKIFSLEYPAWEYYFKERA